MERAPEPVTDRVRVLGRRFLAVGVDTVRTINRKCSDDRESPKNSHSPPRTHTQYLRTSSAPEPLMGRYEVRRTIGHGGFGEVYEAYDTVDSELVAIKRVQWATLFNLRKDKVAHRELDLLRTFKHPNIVVYKDAFVDNGLFSSDLLLVMELCDSDLYTVIHCNKWKLDTPKKLHYMACISSAIAYLHSERIIHRDLKPQNVLMTKEGVPKVTDFGLACFVGTEAENQNRMRRTIAGTPQYVAPELNSGVYDDRVDIWGLGCILYELLVRHNFERQRSICSSVKVHPKLRRQLAVMLSEQPASRPSAQQCFDFFSKCDVNWEEDDFSLYWGLAAILFALYVFYLIFF